GHLASGAHRRLTHAQIAVGERRVAEALSELELRTEGGETETRVLIFKRFVIVVKQRVRRARIGEGQTARRVVVAKEHIGHGLSAFIAWVVSHEDRLRAIGYRTDDGRATFDEHEAHG